MEVAGEKAHREVGRHRRDDRSQEHLTQDPLGRRPGQGRQLEHAGRQDDRRGEQKRELRRVLVIKPPSKPPTIVTRLIPASNARLCTSPINPASR